jgi:hypothetical protein
VNAPRPLHCKERLIASGFKLRPPHPLPRCSVAGKQPTLSSVMVMESEGAKCELNKMPLFVPHKTTAKRNKNESFAVELRNLKIAVRFVSDSICSIISFYWLRQFGENRFGLVEEEEEEEEEGGVR